MIEVGETEVLLILEFVRFSIFLSFVEGGLAIVGVVAVGPEGEHLWGLFELTEADTTGKVLLIWVYFQFSYFKHRNISKAEQPHQYSAIKSRIILSNYGKSPPAWSVPPWGWGWAYLYEF